MVVQWWTILGVSIRSSLKEVTRAWKALSRANHPDKNGGSEESVKAMARINMAYQEAKQYYERGTNHTCNTRTNHYRPKSIPIIVIVNVTLEQIYKGETISANFLYRKSNNQQGERVVKHKLTKEIRDGDVHVLKGKGSCPPRYQVGDVHLTYKVSSGEYTIEGNDLHNQKKISLFDAIANIPFLITLPDGETREIHPGFSQNDIISLTTVKLTGHGLTNKNGSTGDIIIHLNVVFPHINSHDIVLFKRALVDTRKRSSDYISEGSDILRKSKKRKGYPFLLFTGLSGLVRGVVI